MSWLIIVAANAALLVAYTVAVWALLRRRSGSHDEHSLEERFEHQLLHDDLTKLPNRTLFRDRLERALVRSVRRRHSCAVIAVDIDRFKLVNDSLGPAAGDVLLHEVAARLDSCLRPEDTLARSGGDDFMVLLEAVRAPAEAIAVADRITEALSPPFEVDRHELYLSGSIGIALGRGGRDRPEDVLQNAEVAVHRAKDNGGARCEVFRQEMSPHPVHRLGLETELRRAVETMDFQLGYHPIVELANGRVVGAQTIVRWQHPDRGLMEAPGFVPVAEETGLILQIGRWVLETACERAAAWASHPRTPLLCVSLSARQLQQPRLRLVDEVASTLATSGLPPHALCLEITESAVLQDVEAAVAAMTDLKSLGIDLALDFGTGYSSLSHLRRFPLDLVRIDRGLVREVAVDQKGEAIVRALIDLCHALGDRLLGESIENPQQARRLRELGCDLGQGACFSGPLSAEEMEELLTRDRPLLPAAATR
jgi:diguanylate cyclase (GGDEF)-like protein